MRLACDCPSDYELAHIRTLTALVLRALDYGDYALATELRYERQRCLDELEMSFDTYLAAA